MRLFVALCLPDAAVAELDVLQSRLPDGRRVAVENLHLTLAFLGDCAAQETDILAEGLADIRMPPLALKLNAPEVYGGRHGQAVALAADGGDALKELQARVMGQVRKSGLEVGRRRFRPHVTLARLRGQADAGKMVDSLLGARLGPFECRSFGLFESRLFPDGPRYDSLALYSLR